MSVLMLAVSVLVAGCAAVRDPARNEARLGPEISTADLESFAHLRIFFGHQSVGNNILHGVQLVYDQNGVAEPFLQETTSVPSQPAFLAHALVGVNGDPASKIDQFTKIVSSGLGSEVDVVALKLCYVDIVAESDVAKIFAEYSAAMEKLRQNYPNLRIIYTTVPLTTAPSWKSRIKALVTRKPPASIADNIARERYNSLIRGRYGSTGNLFDIALVESTDEAGGRISADDSGKGYYLLERSLSSDGAHLNDRGSAILAGEFIRVMLA